VAGGADLEPSTLIEAYRHGLFPMMVSGLPDVLGWWSPDPRGVIPLDGLRVTKSLAQSVKKFDVRIDTCFVDVMAGCASPSRPDGWIDADFLEAYARLHELGWAHSIEVFDRGGELAGGLYGVRIGAFFAGESMFHRQRDASKVALVALVDLMRTHRMTLLDTQWCTKHLASRSTWRRSARLKFPGPNIFASWPRPRPAEAGRHIRAIVESGSSRTRHPCDRGVRL
jgi:leucyl/phenylalanyl-tRNA---protein transferase